MTLAAGDDQTAATLHVNLDTLVWIYRIAIFAGPVIVGVIATRIAHEMRARIRESSIYPSDATTLVRNEHGGFEEETPQPG